MITIYTNLNVELITTSSKSSLSFYKLYNTNFILFTEAFVAETERGGGGEE